MWRGGEGMVNRSRKIGNCGVDCFGENVLAVPFL